MAIPSVIGGTVETDTGKVKLDSPKGAAWLETIGSFRYEPTGEGKPYTVRKEGKNGEYWYGCRKIEGKVRKKYIGKSSEVSVAKLEEIAEALEVPAEPRVKQVGEVAEQVAEVAEGVAEVAEDRLTALESRFANLEKTLEDLRGELLGKSESGDFMELPKVDNEVVERLQNELSNLKAENESLRQELDKVKYDYSTLVIIDKQLNQEVQEVRSQLAAEETRFKELEEQSDDYEKWWQESEAKATRLETELSDLKQNSESDFDSAGKAGELVSWLRKEVGKALPKQVTVKAVQKILEGGDN